MTTRPLADLAAAWPQIDHLLDEALSLPAAERLRWLDAREGLTPALKDTLRGLLGNPVAVETGDFMQTLHGRLELPVSVGADADPQPGDTVGPWRLLRLLGEGGMGSVFLAERADGSLKRPVALKLPRLGWARGLAERMQRERDILATLEHPGIARLYDAGVDAQGRPWLALEYVQGRPIDVYAREQACTVQQCVALLQQVCEAVAHAHGRLVIHRDLKPGNILVSDEGQVRLLDFGIAKLLSHDDKATPTALTQLAGRAFTLDHASPEQVRGEPLGTASDVYSLGVVAYQLLAGRLPYRLKRGSAAELEEAITAAEIEPPSHTVQDAATARALRGDLDAIVLHALHKDPAARYPTVDALSRDLHRWRSGEAVSARPDHAAYRLRRWAWRQRLPLALLGAVALAVLGGAHAQAAVVVALAAGVLVALWQRREALRQTELARAEGATARRERERAESEVDAQRAVRDLYIEAFSTLAVKAQTDAAALGAPHAVSRVLDDTLQSMLPRTADAPRSRLALLDAVALQLNYTNDFERAAVIGERYLAELKSQGAEAARVILAHMELASSLYHMKDLDACERVRRAGVAWAPAVRDARTEAARRGLTVALARLLGERGQREEATALLARVAPLIERENAGSELHRNCELAQAVHYNGFDNEAALAHVRALQELAGAGRVAPDAQQRAMCILSGVLLATGRAQEAEAPAREGHAMNVRLYGHHSSNAVTELRTWVLALARQGRFTDALAVLEDNAPGAPEPVRLALQAFRAEIAWLHGDVRVARQALGVPERLLHEAAFGVPQRLLVQQVQLLCLLGEGEEAWRQTAFLAPPPGQEAQPSPMRLRWREGQALAAWSAGRTDDAAAASAALLAMLRAGQGSRPAPTWLEVVALEVQALVAAQTGDAGAARDRLQQRARVQARAPGGVESAESLLRQADTRALLGEREAAGEAGAAALAALGEQHPDSPRLAQARRHLAAASQREA